MAKDEAAAAADAAFAAAVAAAVAAAEALQGYDERMWSLLESFE